MGKGCGNRAFRRGAPQGRVLVQEFEDETSALRAETFLISYYGRVDLGTGCLRNLTDGGEGASNPAQEVREKVSRSLTDHEVPAEVRQKISAKLSGRPLSEKTRVKMLGRTPWNKGVKGIPWSKKQREVHEARFAVSNKRLNPKKTTRTQSAEHVAKRIASHIGAKRSAEACLRMRQGWAARKARLAAA